MSFDAVSNFSYALIATAPTPAASGTTLNVTAGLGAIFPAAPFNVVVWPAGANPLTTNAEVVRVTNKGTGDNWTVTRTQESSSARSIAIGDQIMLAVTAKTLTDLQTMAQGTVITTTSTGTQNDFAPGLSGHTEIRCNNATLLTITGLTGGFDGQRVRIVSVGAGQVNLSHQTGGTATSRFINFATSGDTPLAAGSGVAEYQYDGTTTRWRMVAHEQGAWITPTYASGSYTASSGTWTVDSGDVTTQAYYLKGRMLTIMFYLVTTSVSATPTSLIVSNAAWGSFTVAKTMLNPLVYSDNGGGNTAGFATVSAAGTTLALAKLTGSFSIAANTTSLLGTIAFEVQ
jgi:hypothetical protein